MITVVETFYNRATYLSDARIQAECKTRVFSLRGLLDMRSRPVFISSEVAWARHPLPKGIGFCFVDCSVPEETAYAISTMGSQAARKLFIAA